MYCHSSAWKGMPTERRSNGQVTRDDFDWSQAAGRTIKLEGGKSKKMVCPAVTGGRDGSSTLGYLTLPSGHVTRGHYRRHSIAARSTILIL